MVFSIATDFTTQQAVQSLVGGAVIGAVTSTNLLMTGRVTGIAGIMGNALDVLSHHAHSLTSAFDHCKRWQPAFLGGMMIAGVALFEWFPASFGSPAGWVSPHSLPTATATMPWTASVALALIAGAFVGFGTRYGNGCTSGHGVCGLPRFSMRSVVAVSTWFAVAPFVSYIVAQLYGAWGLPDPSARVPNATAILLLIGALLIFYSTGITRKELHSVIVLCKRPKHSAHHHSTPPTDLDTWTTLGLAVVLGVTFAGALTLAEMTNPNRLLRFFGGLTGATEFDPSMMCVFAGAVLFNLISFRVIMGRPSPILSHKWHVPTRTDIDQKLVVGAVLFAVGWALSGLCPGPGLLGLSTGSVLMWVWFGGLLAGMLGYGYLVPYVPPVHAPSK